MDGNKKIGTAESAWESKKFNLKRQGSIYFIYLLVWFIKSTNWSHGQHEKWACEFVVGRWVTVAPLGR